MRKFVLIAALSLPLIAHADLLARAGKNELRLMEAPCKNETVRALIKEEWRDKFHAARADVNGKSYEACWIDTNQGVYFVYYENEESAIYPVSVFINVGI
jgi:hypothetical protein